MRLGPGYSASHCRRRLLLSALVLALLLVGSVLPTVCAQGVHVATAERTAARRIVRVGVYDNPPLIFQDDDGEWQGVYADLLRHVAAQEMWQIEWHACAWTECLRGVAKGEVDLLVAVAHSDERAAQMSFNQETVLANWGQVYVQPRAEIESLLDLEGKLVAGVAQDTHWAALEDMLEQMGIRYYRYEVADFHSVLGALEHGLADAGIVSRSFGQAHSSNHAVERTPIIINPVPLRFAAPLGDPDGLLATFDRHLAELKAQEGSIYHQSLQQHMPAAVVATLPAWVLPVAIAAGALLFGAGGAALWASREALHRGRALARETDERKEAEHALQESEARYRLIFENLMDVVCLLDEKLCLVDVSPSVRSLLGYEPEELIGRSVQELMPNGALERARQDAALLFSEARPEPQVYPIVAKDGTLRHIEIVAAPMGRGSGDSGIVLVARDVTPRLEAEERLRQTRAQLVQAHKMESIALLAGGVAHDFNNMLTAIMGNIELAMLEVEEGTQPHRDLTEARRSAERAAELTRQLLLFSHQKALEMVPTDLGQVVEDLLQMLGRLIGEDIRIVADLCPDPVRILGDAGQLQQVLMNLCLNARDAMPEGGTLTIQVDQVVLGEDDAVRMLHARPGRYARLSVTDTGMGMTVDVQERIFEPFFTTKAPGRGTGLGLSVSYAVVQDHDGWINVYSEPGQGTTFRVYLPMLEEGAEGLGPRQGAASQGVASPGVRGERILLVEDEEDVRRFAQTALEGVGYEVFVAANAADALRLAGQHDGHFDLVFCDMVLPDGTGIELVSELRARYPGLAVLLASGYADQRANWGVVQEEGYPYLQKPYGLTQLLAAVRETLQAQEPPQPA